MTQDIWICEDCGFWVERDPKEPLGEGPPCPYCPTDWIETAGTSDVRARHRDQIPLMKIYGRGQVVEDGYYPIFENFTVPAVRPGAEDGRGSIMERTTSV